MNHSLIESFPNCGGIRAPFIDIPARTPTAHDSIRVSLLDTPLGQMFAAVNGESVCQLEFADLRKFEASCAGLRRRFRLPVEAGANAVMRRLQAELDEYFRGDRREFTVACTLAGTDFQQRVWHELQRIPFAKTACYEDVAKRLGAPSSFRAVARANGANPLYLIVPCHRVIAKNGAISGYGGGVWRKRALIELERTGNISARTA
jgi:O-6-methylguanine DNA methyltransferase